MRDWQILSFTRTLLNIVNRFIVSGKLDCFFNSDLEQSNKVINYFVLIKVEFNSM